MYSLSNETIIFIDSEKINNSIKLEISKIEATSFLIADVLKKVRKLSKYKIKNFRDCLNN